MTSHSNPTTRCYNGGGLLKTTNMTATEYGLRRIIRLETTYIRKQGQGFRLWKGRLIPEADFQQATAMPERPYISVLNPCKKYQYLNIEGNVLENLEKLISCEQ